MNRIVLAVIIAVVAWCIIGLLTLAASAQQQFCGPERSILRDIFELFGEVEIWRGEAINGEVVMTRAEDGSWSIVAVNNGFACVMASGLTSAFDKGV